MVASNLGIPTRKKNNNGKCSWSLTFFASDKVWEGQGLRLDPVTVCTNKALLTEAKHSNSGRKAPQSKGRALHQYIIVIS